MFLRLRVLLLLFTKLVGTIEHFKKTYNIDVTYDVYYILLDVVLLVSLIVQDFFVPI